MGRNRGNKVMLKHQQMRDISLVSVGKGITSSKTQLASVKQHMKWASVTVLHEKPVPHFLTITCLSIFNQTVTCNYKKKNPVSMYSILPRWPGTCFSLLTCKFDHQMQIFHELKTYLSLSIFYLSFACTIVACLLFAGA